MHARERAGASRARRGPDAGGAGTCDTPLEANLKLGQQLNVTGTPAIIFPDGSRAPGLIDAATLERKFAALKKS